MLKAKQKHIIRAMKKRLQIESNTTRRLPAGSGQGKPQY